MRARLATPAALLLAAVGVMVLRRPEYFTAPNFWAEEGTLYFTAAWTMPWGEALLARPAGYVLLWANLATMLAARLVSLRDAPLVTTLAALLAQVVPLALIAFGLAPEWRGMGRKALGMAIVLFASLTGEVWLNTINSQFHFGLAAALLLLEPAELSRMRGLVYAVLLALAGLTGPVAASLAPLFLVRAARARTPSAVAHAAVVNACLVLQGLAVWSAGPLAPVRQAGLGLATAGLVVWMKTIVLPVLGVDAAHRFIGEAVALVGPELAGSAAAALGVGLLLAAGGLVVVLAWQLPARVRIALAAGYVILTAAAVLGGVGDRRMFLGHAESSSRYFYAPGAVLLLLLMANGWPAGWRAGPVRAGLCGVLLAAGVILGMLRYRDSLRWQPWWPAWRDQVTVWERDPRRPLAIWPPPGWVVTLPRR